MESYSRAFQSYLSPTKIVRTFCPTIVNGTKKYPEDALNMPSGPGAQDSPRYSLFQNFSFLKLLNMGIQKKVTRDRIPKPIKSDQTYSKFICWAYNSPMSGIFPEGITNRVWSKVTAQMDT